MSNKTNATRLQVLAEELGCSCDQHWAQTGTIYLSISHKRLANDLKVRFANHSDAYGTSDYTADDVEGTASGARAFLLENLGIAETTVRRLRRARKASDRRAALAGDGCTPIIECGSMFLVRLRTGALKIGRSLGCWQWSDLRDPTADELADCNRRWKEALPNAQPIV